MKTNWNDILGHYKGSNYNMGDVESVMQAQEQQVKILARLKPIFVAMGGLEKSDDGD